MRQAFMQELMDAARANPKIILMVGDLGWGVVEEFAKMYPKQFINAGVAEQNMMGMAAGMASEGYHVFVYSIANFPTFRCAEQIRNDVDYHNLPVTIVAVGGGVAYGALGYSHHAVQDYALMRSMPNMLIASPADDMELRACVRYLVEHPQPSYLRMGRGGEPLVHAEIPNVAPGEMLHIRVIGEDSAIVNISTGTVVPFVRDREGSHFTVPLWGMPAEGYFMPTTINIEVHTFEDHYEGGGFGSWVQELQPQKIHIHGLRPTLDSVVARKETILHHRFIDYI